VDGEGNIIVADFGNDRVRQMAPDGWVTTIAGSEVDGDGSGEEGEENGSGEEGDDDGQGAKATLDGPCGVAVDGEGSVIVADGGNDCVRQIAPYGTVTTIAGSEVDGDGSGEEGEENGSGEEGDDDGQGAKATLDGPCGVAVDGDGNIIVADCGNHRVRQIAPDGTVTTVAGSGEEGYKDGSGTEAKFVSPCGVAVDGEGNIIVADGGAHCVRKIYADFVRSRSFAAPNDPSRIVAPIAADLLRMLASGKHADVTFSVEGQLIGAHRNVCARGPSTSPRCSARRSAKASAPTAVGRRRRSARAHRRGGSGR
jgi:DNA-binding beta-propeller fold protein YncE